MTQYLSKHLTVAAAAFSLLALSPAITAWAQSPQAAMPSMPSKDMAMAMVAKWPEASQKAAKTMMDKYGAPQEATDSRLMWRNNGPWLWTRVDNYETAHEFPAHHTDVMEQAISYKFKPDMGDELAAYDGSVYLRRTEGVISARCDQEGANFLALNLANDVNTGKKTVTAARTYYTKAIKEFKASGKMDPYMTELKFAMMKMAADKDMPQS